MSFVCCVRVLCACAVSVCCVCCMCTVPGVGHSADSFPSSHYNCYVSKIANATFKNLKYEFLEWCVLLVM